MLRVIVIALLVILAACTVAVIAVVLYSGEYDHREEEWLHERQERQEKPRPPDPDVLYPAWPEDKRHSGLLEDDEYD